MVDWYDLDSWGLSGFNCSSRDIDDINHSIEWMLTDMSFEGSLDADTQMDFVLSSLGMGGRRSPSQARIEKEKQITKNYFLARGVKNRNVREVQAAISLGANVSEAGMYARSRITPIVSAAASGSLDIVKMLVDAGADPDQQQRNGESALADAANYDHYDVAEYLLDHGADPNIEAHGGLTPLAVAESARMVKLLLAYGADPNIPDKNGDFPIIARIDNRDYESVRLLIDAGTDLDKANRLGESARNHGLRSYDSRIQQLF